MCSMSATLHHNLELKARYPDLRLACERVQKLGARPGGIEVQTDTYFSVPHGRLKLRAIEGKPTVLIWYDRPDGAAFRDSGYYLVPVPDTELMTSALTAALGVRGVVRKRREILFWHNVRIHLDEVEGLGTFLEFEAVLAPGAELEVSRARLDELARVLEIRAEDRIAGSYANLLDRESTAQAR